MRVSDVGSK